jgi:hypothetical protein
MVTGLITMLPVVQFFAPDWMLPTMPAGYSPGIGGWLYFALARF